MLGDELRHGDYIKTCCYKMAVKGYNVHSVMVLFKKTEGCAICETPELVMIINKHLVCKVEDPRIDWDDVYSERFYIFFAISIARSFPPCFIIVVTVSSKM